MVGKIDVLSLALGYLFLKPSLRMDIFVDS